MLGWYGNLPNLVCVIEMDPALILPCLAHLSSCNNSIHDALERVKEHYVMGPPPPQLLKKTKHLDVIGNGSISNLDYFQVQRVVTVIQKM